MIRIAYYNPDTTSKEKRFYVYLHRDPNGTVFYVGKGTGKRAWEQARRHDMWSRYIARFNGNYQVEIVKDQLAEAESLDLEDDLIREYGGQLVNWANSGIERDYDLLDRYWELRKANEDIYEKACALENTDLVKAVELYRTVVTNMFEYETLNTDEEKKYTGLALEIYLEFCAFHNQYEAGKLEFLDRLTICLKKLKRQTDIRNEVSRYIDVFPSALNRPGMYKIIKRAKMNESIEVLTKIMEWTERSHTDFDCGVHPWPYAELAKLYRKQKDLENESAILERFAKHKYSKSQEKAAHELLKLLDSVKDKKS